MNTTLKRLKVVFGIVLILCIALTLVACGGKKTPGGGGKEEKKVTELTPDNIKKLPSLTYYGKLPTDYEKQATDFNYDNHTYAGSDCSKQISDLQYRIDQKDADVRGGSSTSAFVKIFAKSTPKGILETMAKAALSYTEMKSVVDYLSGSVEDPDIDQYILKTISGTWTGRLTSNLYLDEKKGNAYLNDGWSFFDDYDLYDRLQDYAGNKSLTGTAKENAEDNASWVYRSILKKVYENVALDGAPFARLATYLLDYAIDIVESSEMANASISSALNNNSEPTGQFAVYCMTKADELDPYSGLGDYDCLSYLLSFNDYYTSGQYGLKAAVGLYGYYYDYNKTYYNVALKNEDTYKKQLKYEKLDIFSNDEWLDYVNIQRTNYESAYRYSEEFYDDFYLCHLEFQKFRDENDALVYSFGELYGKYGITKTTETYTSEMSHATSSSGQYDGVNGQLAFGDWLWCYSGNNEYMKSYNTANTAYQNGKDSNSEAKYEGQFKYEMEQLKIADYLLTNMTPAQLANTLYFECYSYSASMESQLDSFLKQIRYIDDNMEEGTYYTHVADEIQTPDIDVYCSEKLAVLYSQAYTELAGQNVPQKAQQANQQSWEVMKGELEKGMTYDYDNAKYEDTNKGEWENKCERLEDNIIQKTWSCCNQNCATAEVAKCPSGHIENSDHSPATKEYDSSWKISLFASKYETILKHTANNVSISYYLKSNGYQWTSTNTSNPGSYNTGYYLTNGNKIGNLNSSSPTKVFKYLNNEEKEITITGGKVFIDDVGSDDLKWWNSNKNTLTDNNDRVWSEEYTENISGTSVTMVYTYTFTGWYLDVNCRYEFCEDDEIPINLSLYAGYNVVKTKKQ